MSFPLLGAVALFGGGLSLCPLPNALCPRQGFTSAQKDGSNAAHCHHSGPEHPSTLDSSPGYCSLREMKIDHVPSPSNLQRIFTPPRCRSPCCVTLAAFLPSPTVHPCRPFPWAPGEEQRKIDMAPAACRSQLRRLLFLGMAPCKANILLILPRSGPKRSPSHTGSVIVFPKDPSAE